MHILRWAAPLFTVTVFCITYGWYFLDLHSRLKGRRDAKLRRERAAALKNARRL